MMVDIYDSLGGPETGRDMAQQPSECDYYPKQFLFDLTVSLLQSRPGPSETRESYAKVDICPRFHVHPDEVSCTKKGSKRSRDEMEK